MHIPYTTNSSPQSASHFLPSISIFQQESQVNKSALNIQLPSESKVFVTKSSFQLDVITNPIQSQRAKFGQKSQLLSPLQKKNEIISFQNKSKARTYSTLQQKFDKLQKINLNPKQHKGQESTATTSRSTLKTPDQPVTFKGKPIYTKHDILKLFDFTPEKNPLEEDDKNIESKLFLDEEYLKLINSVRPKERYFKFGLGEKLLYLSKIDQIHYDIVDEERKRKVIMHEQALQRARDELDQKN